VSGLGEDVVRTSDTGKSPAIILELLTDLAERLGRRHGVSHGLSVNTIMTAAEPAIWTVTIFNCPDAL
jgi:hypothetical protein